MCVRVCGFPDSSMFSVLVLQPPACPVDLSSNVTGKQVDLIPRVGKMFGFDDCNLALQLHTSPQSPIIDHFSGAFFNTMLAVDWQSTGFRSH